MGAALGIISLAIVMLMAVVGAAISVQRKMRAEVRIRNLNVRLRPSPGVRRPRKKLRYRQSRMRTFFKEWLPRRLFNEEIGGGITTN